MVAFQKIFLFISGMDVLLTSPDDFNKTDTQQDADNADKLSLYL